MKALIYDAPETLGYREVQMTLFAVKVNNSSGSRPQGSAVRTCMPILDMMIAAQRPLILGHEAAGTIMGGGRDGERVTINPLVHCGTCHACKTGRENLCPDRQIISMPPREGAFAQYVTMPDTNLVSVPDHVLHFSWAALTEPSGGKLACSPAWVRSAAPQCIAYSALVLGWGRDWA